MQIVKGKVGLHLPGGDGEKRTDQAKTRRNERTEEEKEAGEERTEPAGEAGHAEAKRGDERHGLRVGNARHEAHVGRRQGVQVRRQGRGTRVRRRRREETTRRSETTEEEKEAGEERTEPAGEAGQAEAKRGDERHGLRVGNARHEAHVGRRQGVHVRRQGRGARVRRRRREETSPAPRDTGGGTALGKARESAESSWCLVAEAHTRRSYSSL